MTGPSTKRRLIDRSPPPANSAPLLAGTGLVTSRALLTVPPTEAKFWLYLTRIAPSVPLAEVEAFAREQLGTEDATVVRLLAKDRDPSTLSFISYKVGLSPELRDKALDPTTWPCGMVFREFADSGSSSKTTNSFRQPNLPAPDSQPPLPAPTPSQSEPVQCA
uniref:Uncharacterized protein n=1 Tax=Anopheles atroparvus TaxID=41427 RepID=A0A182J088_ANOAO